MTNTKERRGHPRFETALEVRYFAAKNAAPVNYTVSKDISRSGIRIPCFGSVKEGNAIYLDIDLKGGKPSFSGTGKVVWTRKLNRRAPLDTEAGVEFTKTDRKEIESLIKRLS